MRFKRVYIEISNICNLNCEFCSPLKRAARSMTKEEFSHIATQIKPYTDFIYFHVKGEPLMHPLLETFLDIAHQNGLRVNLTTNATLLEQRKALLLSHPAVRQVNLSLHAANQIDKAKSSDYIRTAIDFALAGASKNIFVVMRFWNLDKNNGIDQKSLDIMSLIERKFELDFPLVEHMAAKQSVKLRSHAFVGWEQEFEWPSLANPYVSDKGKCYGMRYQIAILADGTVVPCCLDANGEAPLGNIYEEDFGKIIETKLAKDIRHGFENEICVAELCKHCTFREQVCR